MKRTGVQRMVDSTASDDSVLRPEMWWRQHFTGFSPLL